MPEWAAAVEADSEAPDAVQPLRLPVSKPPLASDGGGGGAAVVETATSSKSV